jgi:putative two-component system response regulator
MNLYPVRRYVTGALGVPLAEWMLRTATAMTADDQDLRAQCILAVDDEESNLLLLRRILERAGYAHVATTQDPFSATAMFVDLKPDLVLLDLHMPGLSGLELIDRLAALTEEGRDVPVLVLTADATDETKRRALAAGARDFLTKPLDRIELLLRVRNLLQVKQLQDRLREHNSRLEHEVVERTRDLDQARVEILQRLALAAEYRDDETQEHAWRIGRICALLGVELELPQEEAELLSSAAPLHDLGKIGISDTLLLKPGRLSEDEFAVIQTHTTIGAGILAGSRSPVLQLAEQIALTHHERWDGVGYPARLGGDEIPVVGRVVAVADVFDALTHERPYKPAWPVRDAVDEIKRQAGRQFDPVVVDAFCSLDHSMLLSRIDGCKPPLGGRARSGRSVLT